MSKIGTETGRYWDKPLSLVDGCTPCSPGCDNCWSKALAERFHRWPDKVIFREDRLDIPMKTRKPTVFCVWNDLFHDALMLVDIDKAFGIMAQCPEHTFLVLTKRSYRLERAMKDVDDALQDLRRDNVWVGTTVCNQTEANAKIPELLKVPGHKWLSIEPCLGPVDLSEVFGIYEYDDDKWSTKVGSRWKDSPDWVVVGAETGPHRRPCSAHWIRTIVLQCEAAGVPVWVKAVDLGKKVSHDMNEWPEDLRAREVPWEERT